MTVDVLSPGVLHRPIPVEFDLLRGAAFAAMTHPGGRPWRLSPVGPGERARIAEQVPAVREYGGAVLVVIGSNHDAPAAHLYAGQAAQRVALTGALRRRRRGVAR